MIQIRALIISFLTDINNRTRSLGGIPLFVDPTQAGIDIYDVFVDEIRNEIRRIIKEEGSKNSGLPLKSDSGSPDTDTRGKY